MPTMIHVTYADGSVGKFGPTDPDDAEELVMSLASVAVVGGAVRGAVAVEEEVGTPLASTATAIEERAHVVAFLILEAKRNWGIGSDEAARFTVMLDSLAKRIENGHHMKEGP